MLIGQAVAQINSLSDWIGLDGECPQDVMETKSRDITHICCRAKNGETN